MGFFDRFFNRKKDTSSVKLMAIEAENYYSWDGVLYRSDVVRSAVGQDDCKAYT